MVMVSLPPRKPRAASHDQTSPGHNNRPRRRPAQEGPPRRARERAQITRSGATQATRPAAGWSTLGGSDARSNAAVLTQCDRLASGPVLALTPAEAGMPAHAHVLRGRIEGAAGV